MKSLDFITSLPKQRHLSFGFYSSYTRQSHIIWMLTQSPMTVVTTTGTTVLNYRDSMVVESKAVHSAKVQDSKDATFLCVDYGKNYTETQEIYQKITNKIG